MRKLTRRDLLATLIIAAVVVPFIGYSARESMPFVHDPRGMAAVGVAGGLLAFAVLGCTPFGTGSLEQTMGPSQCSPSDAASPRCPAKPPGLLVLMMAGIVIMWALALARDAGYLTPNHDAKHT